MLNRRRLLFGGTAVAVTAVAGTPIALHAAASRQPWNLPVSDDIVAWLKANALPLATTKPGSSFEDLEFLRATVGNARVVSLGEATHATREFFQLKHRVIEYCVAELGFTMIAFEANYGDTFAVNDYVLHGKGTAADVVAGMNYWIWNTEEVVALVEWVRAWNAAHDRKVKFLGFDMQQCLPEARYLVGYLKRLAPDLALAAEAILPMLPPNAWTPVAEATRRAIIAQVKTILASFDAERARWVSRSGESKWHLARRSAVVVEQCLRCPGPFVDFMTWRDRCMADNVRSFLEAEGPQAKVLLWAHNAHVRRTPWLPGALTMGGFLHDHFGTDQVVIGFSFNQGGFRLPAAHSVGPAAPGYVDAALARTGLPLLALDLSLVPRNGPVATWMASKPLQRSAASGSWTEPRWYTINYWRNLFDPPLSHGGDPRENFDILLFVETSTPSRPQRA